MPRRRIGVRSSRRPRRPGWRRCTAFAWLPPLGAGGRRRGAHAGHQPDRPMGQAQRPLFRAGLAAAHHGAAADASVQPWPAGGAQFRHDVALQTVRLACANSPRCWSAFPREAPDGLPRLEAAAALALSGVCLDDSPKRLEAGLERLEEEIARQILPDGGHVSRSPEDAAQCLSLSDHGDGRAGGGGRSSRRMRLRNARDRMAPMLRFFRHGDGALALFQGGLESDPRMIAGLLARDEVRGQPFHHARHSGYQRLAAGRTMLQLDCGAGARRRFSRCTPMPASWRSNSVPGPDRLVVNCGAGGDGSCRLGCGAARHRGPFHPDPGRHAPAPQILPPGLARDLLGPRLMGGPASRPAAAAKPPRAGWWRPAMTPMCRSSACAMSARSRCRPRA